MNIQMNAALPLNGNSKRQRTGALHDASAWSRAPGQRASVLDCASPLARSHGLTGARFRGRGFDCMDTV